jgi:putative ABC transport system ATP-binding protein
LKFCNLIPVLIAQTWSCLFTSPASRAERIDHVVTALSLVNSATGWSTTSGLGGEQQGSLFAITDPTILVADEPTGDLDRVSAEEVLNMMERLNGELKKTIIMVTHDPRAAKRAKVLRHLEKGVLNDALSQDPF